MKNLLIPVKILLVFTVLTGLVYPLLITGIAQAVFPGRSNGSLITSDDKTEGSALIGQEFRSERYFSSRPSAISYNPLPSGGSNYALTNPKLKVLMEERKKQFIAFNHLASTEIIPGEMLFASASGLDPHISPASALLQMNRVAEARHFNVTQKQQLKQLIQKMTERPQFSIFGEDRINVLLLNLEVDKIR